MAIVSMKQLLEAGVHFGHQTRRWNPKMKKYIFAERNGIYILDLQIVLELLSEAYNYVSGIASKGGTVLFVGTKKQAQESVENEANRCEMPYVNNRWLGGLLTNFGTISKRLERLRELEELLPEDGVVNLPNMSKKDVLKLRTEKKKLKKNLEGIKQMKKLPDAIYIVDSKKEAIAVEEARKLGIKVVGIVDTNCDPDVIDYVIPGNDDAIRGISLITHVIANGVAEGLLQMPKVLSEEAGEKPAEKLPEKVEAVEKKEKKVEDEKKETAKKKQVDKKETRVKEKTEAVAEKAPETEPEEDKKKTVKKPQPAKKVTTAKKKSDTEKEGE